MAREQRRGGELADGRQQDISADDLRVADAHPVDGLAGLVDRSRKDGLTAVAASLEEHLARRRVGELRGLEALADIEPVRRQAPRAAEHGAGLREEPRRQEPGLVRVEIDVNEAARGRAQKHAHVEAGPGEPAPDVLFSRTKVLPAGPARMVRIERLLAPRLHGDGRPAATMMGERRLERCL